MVKRKYLIILLIFIIFILSICYYIYKCMDRAIPSAKLMEDSDIIKNFILKNENKKSLKTFIAVKEISTIKEDEKEEFYAISLIKHYDEKDGLLVENESILKLYKITFKDAKIIDSNSIDVNNIDFYNDYNIFPKKIIEKYLEIKDEVNLSNKIEDQVNAYYKEKTKKKTDYSFYIKLFIVKVFTNLKKHPIMILINTFLPFGIFYK